MTGKDVRARRFGRHVGERPRQRLAADVPRLYGGAGMSQARDGVSVSATACHFGSRQTRARRLRPPGLESGRVFMMPRRSGCGSHATAVAWRAKYGVPGPVLEEKVACDNGAGNIMD